MFERIGILDRVTGEITVKNVEYGHLIKMTDKREWREIDIDGQTYLGVMMGRYIILINY